MATVNSIRLKRSSTTGFVPSPSQLLEGELFINLADRLIFMRDVAGNIVCVGKVLDSLDPDEIYIPLSSYGAAPNYGVKGTLLVSNGAGSLVPFAPGASGQALVSRSTAQLGIAWETVSE